MLCLTSTFEVQQIRQKVVQICMSDVQRHQELSESFVNFLFCWRLSPLVRVQIVGRREETISCMGSSTKEGENL